jgi:hypothetical protein
MKIAPDGIRIHAAALASELFDLGPDHEHAPELRRRILTLMRLARASAEPKAVNPSG